MGIKYDPELDRRDPSLEEFQLDAEFRSDSTIQCVRTSPSATRAWQVWKRGRSLGGGQFGKVWQESFEGADGDWLYRAVKVCPREQMDNAGIDYKRELSALAAFSASKYAGFFVSFHGWWLDSENVFFAMEYMGRGDLSNYVTAGLEEFEAKEITENLLSGLSAMHQEGFTHRDIKPQNVLVVQKRPEFQRWWVKIGDFSVYQGISKRILEDSGTSLHTSIGTRPYTAPEVLGYLQQYEQSSVYTSKVDMWSLGCVLFNIGTRGHLAFSEGSLVRYVDHRIPFNHAAQKIYFNSDGVSLIKWLLQPEPKKRITALEAMRHPWLSTLGNRSFPDISPLEISSKRSSASSLKEPFARPQNRETRNYNSFLESTASSQSSNHASLESDKHTSNAIPRSKGKLDREMSQNSKNLPSRSAETGSPTLKNIPSPRAKTVSQGSTKTPVEGNETAARGERPRPVPLNTPQDRKYGQPGSQFITAANRGRSLRKMPRLPVDSRYGERVEPPLPQTSTPRTKDFNSSEEMHNETEVAGSLSHNLADSRLHFEKVRFEEGGEMILSLAGLNYALRRLILITGLPPKIFPTPRTIKDISESHFQFGNLVFKVPVAQEIREAVPRQARNVYKDELMRMRFTAVGVALEEIRSSPTKFLRLGDAEILVQVTLNYRRSLEVANTLSVILRSISLMESYGNKVVVSIVGSVNLIHPSVFALFSALGIYCRPCKQIFVPKYQRLSEYHANIYEYTSHRGIKVKRDIIEMTSEEYPCRFIFTEIARGSCHDYHSAIANALRPSLKIVKEVGDIQPFTDSFVYKAWEEGGSRPPQIERSPAPIEYPSQGGPSFWDQYFREDEREAEYQESISNLNYAVGEDLRQPQGGLVSKGKEKYPPVSFSTGVAQDEDLLRDISSSLRLENEDPFRDLYSEPRIENTEREEGEESSRPELGTFDRLARRSEPRKKYKRIE